MGNVLKSSRYRLVDNRAFEMPIPLKFTVLKEDAQVCEYLVDESEQVSYKIITKYKELMLTTIQRPLNISDIYYLFSCRVFQDRTPFTYPILDRMGLDKYNVYNILTRTHGITPYDEYWIRFDGEKLNYDEALKQFEEYMIEPEAQPEPAPVPAAPAPVHEQESPAPAKQEESPDVSAILNQHKVDVDSLTAGSRIPVSIAPETSYAPAMELENNKMSEAEIENLLRSVGIDDKDDEDEKPENSAAPDISVGSADALPVDGSSRSEEYSEPSGGKMSQEDIEKLLAASALPEPAKTAPEPSGVKLSQDDIEKLLMDSLAAPAPKPEPAPEPEKSEPSGGKMSQEDIEKLLAANAPAQPEPAPEPEKSEPSGGKMSQEDIEKLLAANAPAQPEPAPEPEKSEPEKPATAKSSGRKSAHRDTKKALMDRLMPSASGSDGKAQSGVEKAYMERLAPSAEPETSGGKMSQEDIEKLLAANAPAEPEPAPEPEPVPVPDAAPSGGKMSQDDIEALLNSMKEEANR